jgi:hypothetical protein
MFDFFILMFVYSEDKKICRAIVFLKRFCLTYHLLKSEKNKEVIGTKGFS